MTQNERMKIRRDLEDQIHEKMCREQAKYISDMRMYLPKILEGQPDSMLEKIFRVTAVRSYIVAAFEKPTTLPMKELRMLATAEFPLLQINEEMEYDVYLYPRKSLKNA